MKTKASLLTIFTALSISALTVSCESPASDQAKVAEAQETTNNAGKELKVDLASSSIGFTGYGVGKDHPGKFKLSDGTLLVNDSKLTGGKFTIDVNSMAMDQTEDFITGKLRPHLLSPDFFDAAQFPTAVFEITKVEPYTPDGKDSSVVAGANQVISGNLTMKGVTKNISFPAKVEVTGNDATAAANFTIDRTWWNMSYGNDQSLKDKFISPNVSIRIAVAAKAKE